MHLAAENSADLVARGGVLAEHGLELLLARLQARKGALVLLHVGALGALLVGVHAERELSVGGPDVLVLEGPVNANHEDVERVPRGEDARDFVQIMSLGLDESAAN